MKQLPSISINNFKDGMYSSDASELAGKAILLKNAIHDEELGKTIKVKDYLLTQLNNWATEYFIASSTDYTIEDMVFFSPEENEEYLMVAVKLDTLFAIYTFLIESGGTLFYTPEMSFPINELVRWVKLSVAGKVLRISYQTTNNANFVKWYGKVDSKEMFFIDGMPQHQVDGYFLDSAKPRTAGIYFGTYSLGEADIETDDAGRRPEEEGYTSGIEYYKNYKLSVQVDDAQESEFADLMISTVKTATAPTFNVNVDPGFSDRLSKIHLWRRISKDSIDYSDSHELIKTIDVAKNKGNTIFEENIIPITEGLFAVDYYQGFQLSQDALINQRVLVSDIPIEFGSSLYDDLLLKLSYLGDDYYWTFTYEGTGWLEFKYIGSSALNTVSQLISSSALISVGTYDIYGRRGSGLTGTAVCQLTVDDVSYNNLFIKEDDPLVKSAHVGHRLIPKSRRGIHPDSIVDSNEIGYIVSDTALCTYRDNENIPFSLIGTSEVVSQFELNPSTGGYTFQFTDDKPFEFGSGQFYEEEHGIIRGDFPLYSNSIKYNNRLFVIDGPNIRWSEVFKYDMFRPESIYTGKNDFTHLAVFRDVLFAFSENDVVILNYAGTEVNWRTSDTLDEIGTKYTRSIQVSPVGIFFTDGKGIYVLASQMQMGKQSYTEYQRIDDPIKDLIDFDGVAVDSLVGHYDIKNSRYVLSNEDDGNQYVFSVNGRGWFIRDSADYPSIIRSLGRYGLVKSSAGDSYFTQFIDGTINDDQVNIDTGWLYIGDPSNQTWWRELYLVLKNAKQNWWDTTTYTAGVQIEYDDGTIETIDTIDESYFTGDNAVFEETRMKINEKIKKYRLKIYSNYPIFEYDNLRISYKPTGTY